MGATGQLGRAVAAALIGKGIHVRASYAFSRRPEDAESLCQSLATFQPEQWTAVAGITRALIWLGMREYVASNRQLIGDAFKDSGKGWYVVLDIDVADAMPGGHCLAD